MKKTPALSILTPVWNGLPYLKECVDSVLKQNFQNWELIISDNGSTDGTLAYLDGLQDPRIKIFKQKTNLGIMGNVNFLFDQANSPITQILCADDYLITTDSLTDIVNYWDKASPTLGFARFGHIGSSDRKIINLQTQIIPKIIKAGQADLYFFIFWNFPGNLSDVSVRTHLIAEEGYFNTRYPFAGDCDMWSRLGRKYDIGVEPDSQIFVRRHAGVASNYQGLKGELYTQQVEIHQAMLNELSKTKDYDKLVTYFHLNTYSFHYRNALKSALHGRFDYIKTMLKVKSPFLWPKWKQLLFCLPYALFNTHQQLTYSLATDLLCVQTKENFVIQLQTAI
ncbi:glycosyltransferase family 2 protein [Pedobacter mucosus]|uniref:glycosyltransferase family 2 protein n=1 Tax=Pedobacter mucosus TaxID=2895286 RepID=UPI001EE4E13F|nr:glycosyltransferase family 2 protein [Pedobacter mucosus]UKT62236.1 glycosyltransferase [Pedobacter mucosus]